MKNRTIPVIGLALGLILFLGLVKPPYEWVNTGVNRKQFWINKRFDSEGKMDIVLAGDSRVLRGLSPSAMTEFLPHRRIINYGFDANGYTLAYLEAIESTLDSLSDNRAILLSITPQSLAPRASRRNGFLSLSQKGDYDLFVDRHLARYIEFFRPYPLAFYWYKLRGARQTLYIQNFRPDGWIASYKEPVDTLYQIRRYQGRFDNNQVSDEIVNKLYKFVKQWSVQGINVYGIRLPTSEPMLKLEEGASGFDELSFKNAFIEAGGKWFEIPSDNYKSYDGSHLHEESARRLSRELARWIRNEEQ